MPITATMSRAPMPVSTWDHRATVVPTHPRVAELERLGDEIAELAAHLDAATARLLDLIREFDTRGGWNTGFRSCAEWLAWRVGMNLGAARERVRVARALPALPRLAAALARGELSYAKVRALTRVATPETEERLLGVGRAGTASHVERIVRGWRRVDRQAEAREAKLRHQDRALHVFHDDDGTVVLRGRLEPEVGALFVKALDAAREALYQGGFSISFTGPRDPLGDPPTPTQQRADALALLAATALHHGLEHTVAADRYQVVVHVDDPVLADPDQPGQSVLEDGTHVSAETSARLACDASRTVMRHDDAGRIVEVAARNRTIPPALRRALQARDQGCRFPGWQPLHRGASHPALGPRRAHHPLQPGPSLSPTPSRRARGRLPARARAGRYAALPSPGRRALARGARAPAAGRRASGRASRAPRQGRSSHHRPHRATPLAGRAAGPRLGDRRAAAPITLGARNPKAPATGRPTEAPPRTRTSPCSRRRSRPRCGAIGRDHVDRSRTRRWTGSSCVVRPLGRSRSA